MSVLFDRSTEKYVKTYSPFEKKYTGIRFATTLKSLLEFKKFLNSQTLSIFFSELRNIFIRYRFLNIC